MTDRPWSRNEEELARFAAAARVGDLHAIVDVPPDDDLQAALRGPYPQGAREESAEIEPLLSVRTRSRLAPLMTA